MFETWPEQVIPLPGRHESVSVRHELRGAAGWAALLATAVVQLAAVSFGCIGALLRWAGKSCVRASRDALRAGSDLRERVNVDLENEKAPDAWQSTEG